MKTTVTGWEDQVEKLSSRSCENCHSQIHKNWSSSIHKKSWTNEIFQKSYSLEPRDWCIHCHAPLQSQKESLKLISNQYKNENRLEEEGINCAACHVRNGQIYGSRNNLNSKHLVFKDEYLKTPEFCASCHQFNFPLIRNGKLEFSDTAMQNTFEEWRHYGSKKNCLQCHFDNHDLKGPHNAEWMKSIFLPAEIKEEEDTISIYIGLKKERAHSFPSGDLFRSLSVEISQDFRFQNILFSKKFAKYFQKAETNQGTIWNRKLDSDFTISPNEDSIQVTIDKPEKRPFYFRLVYYYHDPELGGESDISKYFLILQSRTINN